MINNIKSSNIMTGSVTTPLSTTTSGSNGTMDAEKFTAKLTCSGTGFLAYLC
ncbi:MAG: hypothetical protein M3P08_01770 [Thermoproteota archaeon]|nr:hypothetical protein [Thermoproteota archaeon]